jgi:uncharacterized membrane-anchored protein
MKYFGVVFTLMMLFSNQLVAENEANLTTEQEQYIAEANKILDSLDPQHGEIKLPNGVATLKVPENFYYLSPEDTETVLVKVWGNPPGGEKTLGMLFPAGVTPYDNTAWGVTVEYVEDGYVEDEDANDINYDELLSEMKESAASENEERMQQGYDAINLVGWAAKPYYDKETHKLHWAKEFKFGTQEINTLNYNIRVLGRKGVLVLNFIAGMDQLDMINSQIDTVMKIADFDEGSRYADFNPDIDTVAAYGIGALVAGKVAAKVGLLATILIFLKKFWILLLFGAGAFVKKLFGRKKKDEMIEEPVLDENVENEDTESKH